MKKLIILLLTFVPIFLTAQLANNQDVYLAVDGKRYFNQEHQIEILFQDQLIYVNGKKAYFNLDYKKTSDFRGTIKGESVINPDGRILITYDDLTGCVVQDGLTFRPK